MSGVHKWVRQLTDYLDVVGHPTQSNLILQHGLPLLLAEHPAYIHVQDQLCPSTEEKGRKGGWKEWDITLERLSQANVSQRQYLEIFGFRKL